MTCVVTCLALTISGFISLKSSVSFNAYVLHLRDGCSVRIESNRYSSSLVSPLMRMCLHDSCVTLAVCVRVTL